MSKVAAFLDRDGTIIRDTDHISRAEDVVLLQGAASAIRRLNQARIAVVVVTNQSGIARGKFGQADYESVRERMEALLDEQGARVDATYMCPHHPDITGPCECRKPGTLLYRRAAEEYGIALERSWFIGDRLRDVEPGATLGGHSIMVPSDVTPEGELAAARGRFDIAPSLDAAVGRVLKSAR